MAAPLPIGEGAFLRIVAEFILIVNILVIIYKKISHISTSECLENPVCS